MRAAKVPGTPPPQEEWWASMLGRESVSVKGPWGCPGTARGASIPPEDPTSEVSEARGGPSHRAAEGPRLPAAGVGARTRRRRGVHAPSGAQDAPWPRKRGGGEHGGGALRLDERISDRLELGRIADDPDLVGPVTSPGTIPVCDEAGTFESRSARQSLRRKMRTIRKLLAGDLP